MHSRWKPWPHLGKFLPTSLSSNGLKQTTQSKLCNPCFLMLLLLLCSSSLKTNKGMEEIREGSRPLDGEEAEGLLSKEKAWKWRKRSWGKT